MGGCATAVSSARAPGPGTGRRWGDAGPDIIADMPPAISFSEKPTIEGELVVLRPVRTGDAPQLAAMDPETLRLTGTHRTYSLAELEHWYSSRAEHNDRLDLAIIERATGGWAGEVVLNDLDADNLSCGFRILLVGPRHFGRGLGTEATRLILAHAFRHRRPPPDRTGGLRVQPESPSRLRESGIHPRGHQATGPSVGGHLGRHAAHGDARCRVVTTPRPPQLAQRTAAGRRSSVLNTTHRRFVV